MDGGRTQFQNPQRNTGELSDGQSTLACVGMGSNLGDRRATLELALARLAETPEIDIRAVSAFRETPPVGGPGGQPPFLNAAAALSTRLAPQELLRVLNRIEDEAGRVRTVRWGERTLDLDLLLFGDRIVNEPGLIVPHPRMAIRRFVIDPLAEIVPELVDPRTGRTVAQLLANLDRRPSVLGLLTRPSAEMSIPWLGELLERLDAILMRENPRPTSAEESAAAAPERWRVCDLWSDTTAVTPTLVIASGRNAQRLGLHEPIASGPRPFGRGTPLVVLELDDPQSALNEILAACAATRAG